MSKPKSREKATPTKHSKCTSTVQSHRPSFHPVRHLSSHNRQSNSFFPSFRLTSLCASHIHHPNSFRLPSFGWFRPLGCVIHARKSSAHTQHGYSFEKNFKNPPILAWCSASAFSGYVAAIECSSVHVERPSSSTSGGQSEGVSLGDGVAAAARPAVGIVVLLVLEVGVEFSFLRSACLVNARHEATEVQVRQL
jgi:hypothetical protein